MEKMKPEMVAPMVVFLATDEAGDINGCTFSVTGGDVGIFREREVRSSIHKDGTWTLDELINIIPRSLARGLVNPVAPQPPKG